MAGKGERPTIGIDQGNRTTPSYVAFTDSERLIGDAAQNQAAVNPINTVFAHLKSGSCFPFAERHRNLCHALKDQVSPGTPLACIREVTIGSHPNRSPDSISIGDEAIQAFTNCLTGDERGKLDSGKAVTVLAYDEDGKQQKPKLKKNRDGHAVLEGEWGSIMRKNGWSRETRMCIWGFPYGGERNRGEPRFVFTDDNI